MSKILFGAIFAATMAVAVTPTFAATASNSQNGTTSSNAYATDEAPRSTAEMPSRNMGTASHATMMRQGANPGMSGAVGTGTDQ